MKIKFANFMSLTEIHFEGTENFIPSSLNLYIDNVIFPLDADQIVLNTDSKKGVIYFETEMSFDHIKELGVTHLQLLPFFDYCNVIDETRQDDSNYSSFN